MRRLASDLTGVRFASRFLIFVTPFLRSLLKSISEGFLSARYASHIELWVWRVSCARFHRDYS